MNELLYFLLNQQINIMYKLELELVGWAIWLPLAEKLRKKEHTLWFVDLSKYLT